jgi:hypothetical protein
MCTVVLSIWAFGSKQSQLMVQLIGALCIHSLGGFDSKPRFIHDYLVYYTVYWIPEVFPRLLLFMFGTHFANLVVSAKTRDNVFDLNTWNYQATGQRYSI